MRELRWGGQRRLDGGEEFTKTVQNVVVTSNNTSCAILRNKSKNTHIPNSYVKRELILLDPQTKQPRMKEECMFFHFVTLDLINTSSLFDT